MILPSQIAEGLRRSRIRPCSKASTTIKKSRYALDEHRKGITVSEVQWSRAPQRIENHTKRKNQGKRGAKKLRQRFTNKELPIARSQPCSKCKIKHVRKGVKAVGCMCIRQRITRQPHP